MMDRKALRRAVVNALAVTGAYLAGGVGPNVWAIDIDENPPALDVSEVKLEQLRTSSFHPPSDQFRLLLPFDRPVKIHGEIEWMDGEEARKHSFDMGDDFSTSWLLYHSFRTAGVPQPYWAPADLTKILSGMGPFPDQKVRLTRARIVAQSIGGGEPETFLWEAH